MANRKDEGGAEDGAADLCHEVEGSAQKADLLGDRECERDSRIDVPTCVLDLTCLIGYDLKCFNPEK